MNPLFKSSTGRDLNNDQAAPTGRMRKMPVDAR